MQSQSGAPGSGPFLLCEGLLSCLGARQLQELRFSDLRRTTSKEEEDTHPFLPAPSPTRGKHPQTALRPLPLRPTHTREIGLLSGLD